jgi:hypothetical protein
MTRLQLKRGIVTLLLILAFVLQGTTSVLAGTTGGITGTVVDPSSSQPVAGARVTAASPSQSATTTSDGAGRFSFVSLAPDTYTITAAATATRDEASVSGITVIADSSQTVSIGQPTKLKVIGAVTSRANAALVKPGTTADVYSISAAQQDKSAVFSGGGTLNSAWSAITAVPGVYIAPNRAGYIGAGPQVSIRGGDYNQIGYELDGIPVNRSFDNYPSSQLSALGQQELQVYTGATPANAEANGLSGYINQVIRTGTAPAYRLLDLGVGTPTFYNKLSFETGGANPSRTFSYYVGAGLYNQNYRYYDQFNSSAISQQWGTPLAPCNAKKISPSLAPSCYGPNGQDYTNGGTTKAYVLGGYQLDSLSTVRDRDDIVNLHFGIPRRDGNKDDVQVLWDYAHFSSNFYNSPNDQGGAAYLAAIGAPVPTYLDGYQFVGSPLGSLLPQTYAGGGSALYTYPQSPLGRPLGAPIAPNFRDGSSNDQAILKLQYQRNFGTNAFLRVYGYTNYSDWLENNPISVSQNYTSAGPSDYDVMNHTRGVSATFSAQVTQQHLVTLQGAYTTANSIRNNNTEMYNGLYGPNVVNSRTVVGVLVDSSNPTNGICYMANGTPAATCALGSGPTNGQFFTLQQAYGLGTGVKPATGTCGGGPCEYLVAGNGLFSTFNGVTPKFYALSLTDNWKPAERLSINLGLRFDRFTFQGQDTSDTAARAFWYAAYNRDNKTNIQNVPSQIEAYNEWQPRLGFTYTIDPRTVIRGSYGRYAEAPNAAFEQYNYLQANDVASLATFGNYGLPTTPGHDVRPQVSNNYDFSLEKQLNRDLSFKLTPFYRKTQDQIQQFYLDQKTNFVSGLNVGKQTSEGIELAVDKGDFSRDGVSGRLSFTYTNSYINYTLVPNGSTIVDPINLAIKAYNAYTAAGGGAPCYAVAASKTAPAAPAACGPGTVANPYYNAPMQALLDPNANYPTFTTFPGPIGVGYTGYGAPYIATLLVQYKRGPLAITPALQFSAGQRYGAPENTPGIQPNLCTGVLAGTAPATDPRYNYGAPGGTSYDATKCAAGIAIPDQFTNRFDGIGAFVRPSSLQLHLQASYDVNKRFQLVGNFTNLINTCFGGTKVPFAIANACGYTVVAGAGSGPAPVGNTYNPGATIQPFLNTPYNPTFAGFPFNFYLEGRLKL